MKNKSRRLSLLSLTLLLYIGMWITSSCKKDKDKCEDNTKLGRVVLVPLIGSNTTIGCQNTRLCASNRFIDECIRDEFLRSRPNFIFPSTGFWSVDFTITAVCDNGKSFDKTFKLPHSDVTVGLSNNGLGLAYSVSGIPIDRNITVAFTVREPCTRHLNACSASMNDCTSALSYAASYMEFGTLFQSVANNSVLSFILGTQNPTAACGCTP